MLEVVVEGADQGVTLIKMEEKAFDNLRLGSIIEIDDTEHGGYISFYRVDKILTDKLVVTPYLRNYVKTYSVRDELYQDYPSYCYE